MEIITVKIHAGEIVIPDDLCACIGYFDGMHIGHQSLFHQVFQVCKQSALRSALITFDPDPWTITKKQQELKHLMTMKQRIAYGEAFGFAYWIILHFDEAMASLSVSAFHALLKSLRVKVLVSGFDFHYAHFGAGNCDTLQEQRDFDVIICKEVKLLDEKISSTRIEQALDHGDVELAAALLGRPFCVEGVVVHGRGLGRTIGFPTANLRCEKEQYLPASGVYAGYAEVGGERYCAILNIGHNPTFNLTEQLSLEVHLLGFSGDLYDRHLTVSFYDYLRDEKKFASQDALIEQLKQDQMRAIALLHMPE